MKIRPTPSFVANAKFNIKDGKVSVSYEDDSTTKKTESLVSNFLFPILETDCLALRSKIATSDEG